METQYKRGNTHRFINIVLIIATMGYAVYKLDDPVKQKMAIIVLCTCTVILIMYGYRFKKERDGRKK